MKKALFVNPFGIGDVIFTFHAVAALQKAVPGLRADLLCNERTAELARMNPDLTCVYEFDRDGLRELRTRAPGHYLRAYGQLVGAWRAVHYDGMFDYSLGREFSFLGYLAGISPRIGFDYRGRGLFLDRKLRFDGYEKGPVAEAQIRLLRLAGVDAPAVASLLRWRIPETDERKAKGLLSDARVSNWTALAPGGGASWGANAVYKQWEPDRFAEAANRWSAKNGSGTLLLGDPSEKPLLERVRRGLRGPAALVCGEGLGTVAALLKRSQLLLCNDGGLLHLAHSLGVKTVSLFGPVDENVYGPYGESAPHGVLTQSVPCRPCYSRFHFPPCDHDRRCLKELSVEKVLESIERIA